RELRLAEAGPYRRLRREAVRQIDEPLRGDDAIGACEIGLRLRGGERQCDCEECEAERLCKLHGGPPGIGCHDTNARPHRIVRRPPKSPRMRRRRPRAIIAAWLTFSTWRRSPRWWATRRAPTSCARCSTVAAMPRVSWLTPRTCRRRQRAAISPSSPRPS